MDSSSTGRGIGVGGSVVSGFVIGIATSVLLFGLTWLFAESELDDPHPLLLFFAGLLTCIGIGITLAALNPDSRRMWIGFTQGLIAAGALVLWWLWYAIGQIGS